MNIINFVRGNSISVKEHLYSDKEDSKTEAISYIYSFGMKLLCPIICLCSLFSMSVSIVSAKGCVHMSK